MQTGRFLSANSSLGRAPTRRRRVDRSRKCFEVTSRGDLKEKALVFLQPPATHSAQLPDRPAGAGRRGAEQLMSPAGKGDTPPRSTSAPSGCALPCPLRAHCAPAGRASAPPASSSSLSSPVPADSRKLPHSLGTLSQSGGPRAPQQCPGDTPRFREVQALPAGGGEHVAPSGGGGRRAGGARLSRQMETAAGRGLVKRVCRACPVPAPGTEDRRSVWGSGRPAPSLRPRGLPCGVASGRPPPASEHHFPSAKWDTASWAVAGIGRDSAGDLTQLVYTLVVVTL